MKISLADDNARVAAKLFDCPDIKRGTERLRNRPKIGRPWIGVNQAPFQNLPQVKDLLDDVGQALLEKGHEFPRQLGPGGDARWRLSAVRRRGGDFLGHLGEHPIVNPGLENPLQCAGTRIHQEHGGPDQEGPEKADGGCPSRLDHGINNSPKDGRLDHPGHLRQHHQKKHQADPLPVAADDITDEKQKIRFGMPTFSYSGSYSGQSGHLPQSSKTQFYEVKKTCQPAQDGHEVDLRSAELKNSL